MPSGKVKWFNAKKGYGFITDSETKKDIFLHVSELENSKLRVLKEEQNTNCLMTNIHKRFYNRYAAFIGFLHLFIISIFCARMVGIINHLRQFWYLLLKLYFNALTQCHINS